MKNLFDKFQELGEKMHNQTRREKRLITDISYTPTKQIGVVEIKERL